MPRVLPGLPDIAAAVATAARPILRFAPCLAGTILATLGMKRTLPAAVGPLRSAASAHSTFCRATLAGQTSCAKA
jgi:hypothetical protein